MQAVAQKSVVRGAAARAPVSRRSVVVSASAEPRSVLSGFLAGAAAIALTAGPASALSSIDLFDDRKAKANGFDIIYEARDLSLSQNVRDGLAQPRVALADTKARIKQSEARLDSEVEPFIQKAYWTEAREQLRRQVGTLRFDLNVLAESKSKGERRKALEQNKLFAAKVEDLDFALRSKNKSLALTKLEVAKQSLDQVLSAYAVV